MTTDDGRLFIQSTSIERKRVVIETTEDPTGVAPEFAAITDLAGDPATYADGVWHSDGWDSVTGRVVAYTATMGKSGADLVLTDKLVYSVFMRWTLSAEVPVIDCGLVEVL